MEKRVNFRHRGWLRLIAVLLVVCTVFGLACTVSAAYPSHTDYIYDGAEILTPALEETMKSTNDTLYSKVKARISICIVESLGGEEIHTYARNLFKEWKLHEGILLVISTGDENYYAVQSDGIESVVTNERLGNILNEFLEPDFAEGNISRGIQKTVNKLASFMKSELPAGDSSKNNAQGQNEGKVTFGSIVLSILKILGWTLVVLVAAFVIFFVAALFNDTAAELMNRLVFSHFTGKKNSAPRNDYYDDRLYGNSRPNRTNANSQGQRRPSQNGQNINRSYQNGMNRCNYGQNVYIPRSGGQQNRQATQRQNAPRQVSANPECEQTRQFSLDDYKGKKN